MFALAHAVCIVSSLSMEIKCKAAIQLWAGDISSDSTPCLVLENLNSSDHNSFHFYIPYMYVFIVYFQFASRFGIVRTQTQRQGGKMMQTGTDQNSLKVLLPLQSGVCFYE